MDMYAVLEMVNRKYLHNALSVKLSDIKSQAILFILPQIVDNISEIARTGIKYLSTDACLNCVLYTTRTNAFPIIPITKYNDSTTALAIILLCTSLDQLFWMNSVIFASILSLVFLKTILGDVSLIEFIGYFAQTEIQT